MITTLVILRSKMLKNGLVKTRFKLVLKQIFIWKVHSLTLLTITLISTSTFDKTVALTLRSSFLYKGTTISTRYIKLRRRHAFTISLVHSTDAHRMMKSKKQKGEARRDERDEERKGEARATSETRSKLLETETANAFEIV